MEKQFPLHKDIPSNPPDLFVLQDSAPPFTILDGCLALGDCFQMVGEEVASENCSAGSVVRKTPSYKQSSPCRLLHPAPHLQVAHVAEKI